MLKLASLLLVFLVTFLIVDGATTDDYQRANFNCTKSGNYTPNSNYQYNLYNILGSFNLQASKTQFSNATLGQAPDEVYGLYMCRGDVFGQNCSGCISTAKDTILKNCPYSLGAIIWFDECLVRYSADPFFGRMDELPALFYWNVRNVTGNKTEVDNIIESTMLDLANEIDTLGGSLSRMKYVTKVVNVTRFVTLYAMEQCTNDLTKNDCILCLMIAMQEISGSSWGFSIYTPSCVVRYEVYPFFGSSTDDSSSAATHVNGSSNFHPRLRTHPTKLRPLLIVSIAIAISIACSIMPIIFLIRYCKKKKKAVKTSLMAKMHDIMTVESLQFDWNTVKVATRNFWMDYKLGQGGFGEVYKVCSCFTFSGLQGLLLFKVCSWTNLDKLGQGGSGLQGLLLF